MSPQTDKPRYRIIDLIKYLMGFFFYRLWAKKNNQQGNDAQKLKEVNDGLQKAYDQIDNKSDKTKARDDESSEDVQNKLNRMF
jgi:hypothetical protein